jgi:sigma-E factor negative regulatory protein RseA
MVNMKDQVSVLMDGELDESESRLLLSSLLRDDELRQAWRDYHLVGAVLRNEPLLTTDITAHVMAALESEPVILAPRNLSRGGRSDRSHGWMAMAASVAGMAFVGWMALIPPDSPSARTIAVSPVMAVVAESAPAQSARLQEYLVAHQAYSPRMSPQGGTRYVRTVSAQRSEGGR